MHFSTRTRYGLRFLVRLAQSPCDVPMQLGNMAKQDNISLGYLEQIVTSLRPLGILKSIRGLGGGYMLSKPPEEIRLNDVIRYLEGDIFPVHCLQESCIREDLCTMHKFWREMDSYIGQFLESKTLKDLVSTGFLTECPGKRS